DAQNNTLLSGKIPTSVGLLIVTVCETHLNFSTPSWSLFPMYTCLPDHFIDKVADISPTEWILQISNFTYTLPPPSSASPITTVAPPNAAINTTVMILSRTASASIASVSAVTTASALASTFADSDAADAQMLVSILGSPCVCSATSPTQQREGSVLLLALSPFSSLGSSWAAIGNSLLCCVLVGLHVLVIRTLSKERSAPHHHQRPPRSVQHADTVLSRWLHDNGSTIARLQLLARLRFPNASCTLMLLLVPGVVRAVVDSANALSDSDSSDAPASIAGICVGVVFVLWCTSWCVEWIAYRHVDGDVKCVRRARSLSTATCLRFELHKHPHKLFQPIPRSVAKILLPHGCWQPQPARLAYGSVVSSYVEKWRRAWVVVPVANIVVQILSGVDVSGSAPAACDALQGLTLCVLASVCAFIAYARPHRALLASYLVCASLVLTMVTALLGLLCRHGAVSPDAVSGFGVFASVAMFVFKLYHVLMPIVERRLMGRNGGVVEAVCSPVELEVVRKSEMEEVNSAVRRGKRPISVTSNQPREGEGSTRDVQGLQSDLQQAEALRQLIEAITDAKRCSSLL
ncbi:GP46-like surface antigen, putative, partial [Bodo saltans]